MTTNIVSRSRRRRFGAVLAIGFLALAVGVVAARMTPPSGYELSIYAATPLAFWIGVAVAVLAAATVALSAPAGSVPRRLAVVLGPLAVLSVVALPLIRGYYFFGAGDALSYLGWARLMDQGRLNPVAFLYPGIQSTAIFVSEATGVPLRRSLMAIPPLFVAAYVVGVALLVGRIASSPRGAVVGAFAALLLLPVNNIHTYLIPYPTSTAIFFAPLVVYFLFRYVTNDDAVVSLRGSPLVSPFGVLLSLAGVAIVIYHPQIGANIVLILVAVLGVQLLGRAIGSWVGRTNVSAHRPALVPTAVVAGFFAIWAPRFDRSQGVVDQLITAILGGGAPGQSINQRGTSLTQLGGGIEELFLKIFAVSALLSVIAGLVMLAAVTRRLGGNRDRNALLTYLAIAFVPVFGLFLAFMVASLSVQQFRYLGFIMAIVTVVVAVAFADGIPFSIPGLGRSSKAVLAVAVFALLLGPQLSMAFMSPHIYQPGSHVTEQTMNGYETAFEHRDPEVVYTGIRGGPRRYVDAHFGTTAGDTTVDGQTFPGQNADIPFDVWGNNMTTFYGRCRYVALSDADYEREVTLYDGFRYSEEGFESMDTSPDIHRVQSNGDFRLYVVSPPGSTCTG